MEGPPSTFLTLGRGDDRITLGLSRVHLCRLGHPPRLERLVQQQGCGELHSWSRLQGEDARTRDNAFRCLPASKKTPPEGGDRRLAGLGVFRDYGFLDSQRFQVSSALAELP